MIADPPPPFGGYVPTPGQERIRATARKLPRSYLGRRFASLYLGPAGGRARRAYDVRVFGSQKARLHPHDNICEKRVFLTPQLWDFPERAALARRIAGHPHETFYFADVGANAGLYALFARARTLKAGKSLSAICVEPDPDMRDRAAFNFAASSAGDGEISVFPCAAAAKDGPVAFAVNRQSRGMSRIDASGDMQVEGRTLASLLAEKGLPRLDAMKIDIEGHEFDVLKAFYSTAPRSLWPPLLIMETSHETPERSAASLVAGHGYKPVLRTALNALFVLD